MRLGETLVGRSPYCTIVVADERVSRQHLALRVTTDGQLSVEDLSSRNGTLVNGKPLRGACALHAGDLVELGQHTLEIESTSAALPDERISFAETGDYLPEGAPIDFPTTPGPPPSPRLRGGPPPRVPRGGGA